MELQRPLAAITSALDGDVLTVLARADDWFSISALQRMMGKASIPGIRKVLDRLVGVGIVEANMRGSSHLYRLNMDHLAAPHLVGLINIQKVLFERIHAELSKWSPPPVYSAIFGSTARQEQRPGSVIDILILYPNGMDGDWDGNLSDLVSKVSGWVGSELTPILFSEQEVGGQGHRSPLLSAILREGIPVYGTQKILRKRMGNDA